MKPPARKTQTRLKHEILQRYLDAWGGIIVSHLRRSVKKNGWRFIYVDCFAFQGIYSGEKEDELQHINSEPVFGSPIIGIQALDKLTEHAKRANLSIITNSILIEQDSTIYKQLRRTLEEQGWKDRIRETTDLFELRPGEIAVINCSSTSFVDELIKFSDQNYTWAFYLLDPWGAKGIPYNFVKKIVSCKRHDVMINFIYEAFEMKSGLALRNHLTPAQKRQVDYWKKAFGDSCWYEYIIPQLKDIRNQQFLKASLDEDIPLEDMPEGFLTEEEVSEIRGRMSSRGYMRSLKSMDENINIKMIDLKFPDKDRIMMILFLTTHDSTGALALNRILWEAKFREFIYRNRYHRIQSIFRKSPMQLSLLNPVSDITNPPADKRPQVEEIAEDIYYIFKGKTIERKDLYAGLVNTIYFPSEIDQGLKYLKRLGKVDFKGNLKHQTQIKFL
jgi:three-Cys-motif partner protein